jgi:glyoxylase-like metal-dependent hydrolase (beta-lactamase superfamily II)
MFPGDIAVTSVTKATLTRRSLLAATAAGLAARALPASPAFAATPTSFKHGAFEITVVSDGHLVLPVTMLAAGAPPAERDAILKAAGQTGEQYNSPTNVTLIRSDKDLILVDMGSGDRFMPTAGKLWANLKSAGIDKNKITKVIFTHGHPDHLWGAVDEFDEMALPNAAFYVGAAEWDFWQGDNAVRGLPAERAGFVTGARRNYAAIKERVTMLKAGDEPVAGIEVISTPGHTQGHVSLAIAGGDGLIVGGDVLTHPLISFEHPEWKPTADHVPDQAVETRKKLLDRLAKDRSKIIGYHLPYPGMGMVERKGNAYRFVAAA